MEPIKILAIGNSFSTDATTYLQPIAAAGGHPLLVRNLFIAGCSLERHAVNVLSGLSRYEYQCDGVGDPEHLISIRKALEAEEWDAVTVQQNSYLSGFYGSYAPFLQVILDAVRAVRPGAKIYFHGTWVYDPDCPRPTFRFYDCDQAKMYAAVRAVTDRICREYALPLINAADLIQALRKTAPFDYGNGGLSLCRDGFHMSLDYGRYALGLLWYRVFTRQPVTGISYLPPAAPSEGEGRPCDAAKLRLIQETVDAIPIP